MSFIHLITTLLCLVDGLAQVGKKCPKQDLTLCTGYHLIGSPLFKAFYPIQELNETCNLSILALKCVENLQEFCSAENKMPYDIHRNVINAVCDIRRHEYIQSIPCFTKPEIESRTHKECFVHLSGLFTCNGLSRIVECTDNVVSMTDGCKRSDAELMMYLVKIFLKPVSELIPCPKSYLSSSNTSDNSVMKVTNFTKNLAMGTFSQTSTTSYSEDISVTRLARVTTYSSLTETTLSQSNSTWNTVDRNETEMNSTMESSNATHSVTTATVGSLERNNLKSNKPVPAHSRVSMCCSATYSKWTSLSCYILTILLFLHNHYIFDSLF